MKNTIQKFSGVYDFLSNFYFVPIRYGGRWYPSVEHAFQAAKVLPSAKIRINVTPDNLEGDFISVRKYIASLPTPGMAKRAGRKVELRADWDKIKLEVMSDLLVLKFNDSVMAEKLVDTGDKKLVEGNYWHDNFWGDCQCLKCEEIVGLNNLGIILMDIRNALNERD